MADVRPVLVVGAGPVGLTAAAFLAHSGTLVRLVDSNSAPTNLSKSLVLWRRSIMTLDPLIPHEHWLTVGCPVRGGYFGDEGAALGHIDLANPSGISEDVFKRDGKAHELPAGYLVTQADVEAALVGLLRDKYGVTVERNTSLASFRVSSDGQYASCVLQSTSPASQQQQQHLDASHVIACDGARSTVRKQLALSFEGCTLNQRWLLADVTYTVQDGINPKSPQQEVERAPLRDALFLCTTSEGIVGFLPVSGRAGLVRIIWNADSQGPAEPTLADFQQLLLNHTRLQIKLHEAVWISEFRINERQVERYVHAGGRVLLAGDAAHIHSPAGGQGMNTGIQDAANLAWKVALVVAGEAAAGHQLIETYQEERWPVGAAVIRTTGMLLRANALRNYFVRMLRLLLLRVLISIPLVRQLIAQKAAAVLAEDDVAYANSSLAESGALSASSSGSSSRDPAAMGPNPMASAAAKSVWGTCRPGYAFPDVSVMIGGESRPAVDLLRASAGCCGTLVVLGPSGGQGGAESPQQKDPVQAEQNDISTSTATWPSKWGHWQLKTVTVAGQLTSNSNGPADSVPGAIDSWGLLQAATSMNGQPVGVLVRPDGIVAAVGGPEALHAWLNKHVASVMPPASSSVYNAAI